jgi:hypothetical protein
MSPEIANQLAGLHRIAWFSAAVRGHKLGEWRTGEGVGLASCVLCGAELSVYFPVIQPEMDGPALEKECTLGVLAGEAA